jgi:hypothetical protein
MRLTKKDSAESLLLSLFDVDDKKTEQSISYYDGDENSKPLALSIYGIAIAVQDRDAWNVALQT